MEKKDTRAALPPSQYADPAAEKLGIAACFENFVEAREVVSAEDFTDKRYGAIFEAIEGLSAAGKEIDLPGVAIALEGKIKGPFGEIAALLADITGDYSAADGRAALPFLRELTCKRQMEAALLSASASLSSGKVEPDKLLDTLQEKISEVRSSLNTEMEGEIDLAASIPPPVALVERGSEEVLHLGDIEMIDGLSKSGKTSICTAIAAAVLGGRPESCLGFSGTQDGARVLWLDTEQHPRNAATTARRILRAAGLSTTQNSPRLAVLSWRGKSPAEQQRLLFRSARRFRPQLLVLDGVTDIVGDFNDLELTSNIITRLMGLAAELDCSVLCVLHLNPGAKGMEGKAVGMLGSVLYKKCSIEIRVVADGDGSQRKVSFLNARNGAPMPFWFTIDGQGPHLCTPAPTPGGNVEKVRSLLETGLLKEGESLTYGDIVKRIVAEAGVSDRTAKRYLSAAKDAGLVCVSVAGNYYLPGAPAVQAEFSNSDGNCDGEDDIPF